MPASAASPITSSRIGTSMSSPSIEKRVLPGKRAVQEPLEGLDLRQPVEQRDRIDRIGRRAEPPAFGRLAQPAPLFGHEHVRVVVAGASSSRCGAAPRRRRTWSRRPRQRRRNQAGRQRAQVLVGDAVCLRTAATDRRAACAAERIEPGREVPVAADRLRQVDRADDLVRAIRRRTGAGSSTSRRRRPLLEELARGGVDRRRVAAVLLVQLQHIAAVQPCEVPPRRHNLIIVTATSLLTRSSLGVRSSTGLQCSV